MIEKKVSIKERAYCDFRLKLAEKNFGQARAAQLELTFNCNFHCLYCYLGSWRDSAVMMDFALAKNIIDKLFAEGFLYLSFSGGEPLLNPDFFKIYQYAKSKGFIITILTNAALIDETAARFLTRQRPFYLDVTFNAVSADLFDKICAVKGAYR